MSVKRIGVLTSGGDAPGMNPCVRAVVRTALYRGLECYGIRRGWNGLITGDIVRLDEKSVSHTINRGGTILYTARSQEFMTEEGQRRAVSTCKFLGLDSIIAIGGDGTFRGAQALSKYGINVIGIPGTIDNDISCTNYCIGFDTAANTAIECIDKLRDTMQSHERCAVVEVMGRHAGWLAVSAALASEYGAGPDLIYLPEVDFSMPKFIEDVKRVYAEKGYCIVAVSEGIHYEDGGFVSEAKVAATDGFGHAQLGGLAAMLAQVVKEETGAKVRGIELSLLQRCGAHLASETDIEESVMSGKAAVENAVAGITDKMVGFQCTRDNGKYVCKTELLNLTDVANTEKKVPLEWINKEHNGVEQPFIDYVLPLIQGEPARPKEHALPRFAKLNKVLTTDL